MRGQGHVGLSALSARGCWEPELLSAAKAVTQSTGAPRRPAEKPLGVSGHAEGQGLCGAHGGHSWPAAAFPHARTWPGSPLPCAPPQLSPQVAGSHLGVFSTPRFFTEHLLRAGHWLGCGDCRRRENEFSDRVGRSPARGRGHYLAAGWTSGERRAPRTTAKGVRLWNVDELCERGKSPPHSGPRGTLQGQSAAGQGGVRETSLSPRRGRGCVNRARKEARRVGPVGVPGAALPCEDNLDRRGCSAGRSQGISSKQTQQDLLPLPQVEALRVLSTAESLVHGTRRRPQMLVE